MSDIQLEANFNSILRGQLPGAELVIGLVGAVGADLSRVALDLKRQLERYRYETIEIRVSELIKLVVDIPDTVPTSEPERSNRLMDKGDEARLSTGNSAILALAVAAQIFQQRGESRERPRTAYIVNSLKHPDEVNALRRIYGNGFLLLGVYVDEGRREFNLIHKKNMSPGDARMLIRRDESEGPEYGQRTRDTYHLSDFFVHLDEETPEQDDETSESNVALQRVLEILFANPYRTPLFDEYAMFMAFAAAARSADLSRQIGAVIARDDELLATGVNECPRYGGGTYWPKRERGGAVTDFDAGRDYKRGFDSNDRAKHELIEKTLSMLNADFEKMGVAIQDDERIRRTLASSGIDDITEYGRVVHAEMDALLACARNTVSCRGATLYTTTFPCHNCAKHIIAAGIRRVVYIEPYPKSKALEFHGESAYSGFYDETHKIQTKVAFEPFVGVGPRRYLDLFSMKQGSGFPLARKDKKTGNILHWYPEDGKIRMPMLPWNYLQSESMAAELLKRNLQGSRDE